MRLLVVAATEIEIGPLISDFGFSISDVKEEEGVKIVSSKFNVLISGVGMVATAFALGRHLAVNQYDLAINLGIAGSFDRNIHLGDVLEITEDTLSELGAEDGNEFIPVSRLGFGESAIKPGATKSDLYTYFKSFNLKTATAITVNTVHGNEATIKKVTDRLNSQLESMEGAAFFYSCRAMNVPCLQIRAVSNYVEKRNRDKWDIPLAIKNLNTFAIQFLKQC